MKLDGKTFLISGGGSGLGEATAREFVNSGANVVIMDVNTATGEKTASDLGRSARFVKTDVTDEQDVNAAIEMAYEAFGSLNGAVNCAGVAIATRVVGRDGAPHRLDSFSKVISVNLIGTFNVVRLVGASIAAKQGPWESGEERGVIVNTASVAAFDGQIGQAAYAASKGGVVALTLPLAREFAFFGIRVCTIAPGLFDTPMMAGLPEEARQSLGKQVPFPPRLGDPAEYGLLARQIVENTMLNGEVIRLDGAIRMAPR